MEITRKATATMEVLRLKYLDDGTFDIVAKNSEGKKFTIKGCYPQNIDESELPLKMQVTIAFS